ncbi:GntR family transcriptional regulator [Mesobacterium pallidum]|uniref:GntR family transcriptional regulator n=1 Tax=Mesobacterium pallidum TaxID=2872037 RepID=UPI001EE2E75D|nr:GntR family transcriptional regulator [Mesobacterium pallidum]
MKEPVLAQQIAAQLRRDILRGKLAPGASVKERDNAAELGVSRTPMREAIRLLATEGLVRLRPSRSPIVAQLDFKEVQDQTQVLVALEKLSAELACIHATRADIDGISRILARMEKHFDTMDPLDMFEVDMSFHAAIARASHNDALAETHTSFMQRLWRARYLSAVQRRNRERVVTQHGQIVDALRARDPRAAVAAIDIHLRNMAEDIRSVIAAENKETQSPESANGGQT